MTSEGRAARRERTRFEIWAWSPVIVLRVALVATYVIYAYASIIAFLAGVPIFDLTTPSGWTPIWAVVMGGSATFAAVGSTSERWERLEMWSGGFLSAMMFAYVLGLNIVAWASLDASRQFVGAIALIAFVLPVTRFVYLAAQSGKRHTDVASDR